MCRLPTLTSGHFRLPSTLRLTCGTRAQVPALTEGVSETTLAIELPDADIRHARRTTTQPVRSTMAQRPRTADTSVC